MAGATTSTFDSALKEDYQPGLRSQLNDDFMILAQVEKNTEDFEGRRAVLSLETGRSWGAGARKEGDSTPTPGAADFAEERIPVRQQVGKAKFTVHVIEASKSDKGSFARAVKHEMNSVRTAQRRSVNRQIFGTSNGVMAATTTTNSSTTLNLATTTTYVQIQQFEQGMSIDVGTVAELGTTPAFGPVTITGVDETDGAMTLTVSSAVSADGSDFVAQSGSGGATTNQRELTGLRTIVAASGTLHNVDPTSDLLWKSTVLTNSGTERSISESLIERAFQTVDRRSGEQVGFMVGTDGVYRSVTNLMRSLKRFNGSINLKGGHSAVSIDAGKGAVALTWERDCPKGHLFGLTTDKLKEFVMADWQWMEKDGAVLAREASETAYTATFYKLHELATTKRNAHFLISDVLES